jgi:mitochondrial Rho GTPase 1
MPHSEYITVLEGLKKISPEFWNSKGITLSGFLFIHARFIKEGRKDAVWNVLWRHCYNNNIEFAENFNPPRQSPDQVFF